MQFTNVYVTVGTTKFDSLIEAVTSDEVLRLLKSRGCRKLSLQIGTGRKVQADHIMNTYGIAVDQYDFRFEPVRRDMLEASLVIGHAGAGTCMDVLQYEKPALIVVNNELMDNHQIELALQLAEEGYIYYCYTDELLKSLEEYDFAQLKSYASEPKDGVEKFVECLNGMVAR